jgi:hypothetical protein
VGRSVALHSFRPRRANCLATNSNVRGLLWTWWTFDVVRPANLDTEQRPWTFWKHSQGAEIETRAPHHKTLNIHARGTQRSQHLRGGEKIELDERIFVNAKHGVIRSIVSSDPWALILLVSEARREPARSTTRR